MFIFGFVSIVEALWQKTATKVEISLIFSFFLRHYVSSKRWYGYHGDNRIDTL